MLDRRITLGSCSCFAKLGGAGGGRGWNSAACSIGFGVTRPRATTTWAPTVVMSNSLGAKE
ncbi:hypothetical protein AUC69_11750 [Methyloceanibacter superfactus]|uniref:Uncharacterized protein n=1 Tax=Methyloceanibacter superfactus TaxID=1774969 RepID=A0A1E3VUU6_9HYPH|nr:hypothetical protein [Methyloceanibacter superfactus]ODR97302.1 hypothetical protein AUC69_11750 [Methyloceanibacter superfactus]